jgi:peptide/nickel transport system substrate-binding protein/oligopeptide transport system substrate-binding protein
MARRLALIAVALSLAWFTGCGGSSTPERDWKTLYRHISRNPTTIDPALARDVNEGRIIAHVYQTLVCYDAGGSLAGDAAEWWSVSPDGRTYSFRIRDGLKFANGRAVTADDVRYSFERTLSPGTPSPRKWVLDRIKGARAFMRGEASSVEGLRVRSDSVVEIELEGPFAPFAGLLTMPAAAVVPREVKDFNEAGFGSGPFRVKSFRADEQLVLERNPCYPGPGPQVDRVAYKIIEPPIAQIAEFRRGLIDLMDVPHDYYEQLSGDPGTKDLIVRTDSFNVYFLAINCTEERFRNVQVRRALAHALNVSGIAKALYPGQATGALGPIPPGIPGYDPEVEGIAHDPARARELLASANFDVTKPIRLLCGSDKDTVKNCQTIEGALRRSGFTVELMSRETGTFKQMLRTGDWDLSYYSWWADYPDAENFLAPLVMTSADRGSANTTGYSNPEVDRLIKASQTELDAAKRARLYAAAQKIVIAEAPRVWLWHRQELTLCQPWVKDYRPSPIYNTDKGNLILIVPPAPRNAVSPE